VNNPFCDAGYVIEMMDKYGGPFVKAAEIHGNTCQGTVPKLEEGNQYQFRVRAVNKAGPGDPSEETNPHIAKARYCKLHAARIRIRKCKFIWFILEFQGILSAPD
jgi:hypothetical protein